MKTPARTNDFVIKIATVNGTGSASANSLLMKAIFRMGVPVVGKNFFPSNIQGLPTWYEIRVTRDRYKARSGQVNLMVAMNAETYATDLAEVESGGYFLYDSTWPRNSQLARDDVTVIGIPFSQMCNESFADPRARILMKNIGYLGALVALLDIDVEVIHGLLAEIFADKKNLVEANLQAIDLGHRYAREHFDCPLPMRIEPMSATDDHIMIDGNTAAALGCLYSGATVASWYPITPSTSLMDAFKSFCATYRRKEASGRNRYCIIQSEDELAAIGMVLGASWNGARAFTATSGPGLSLMSEFLGFGYYAEIPAVVFDVQRVGPSTGMPTRTQQADVLSAVYASHGDTKHVVLFPADPEECFYFAVRAFDLADRLQTPVIVLSDLDIGMNDWMCPVLKWDDAYRPDRGKVLTSEQLGERPTFSRYLDEDGDGIAYRTYPGQDSRGAYFVRGSGHNRHGLYTEDAAEYREVLDRLLRKLETARQLVPVPIIEREAKINNAIVAFGSSDGAVRESIDRLAERGVPLNYMRVRAFPFDDAVREFLAAHETVFVVEQNRDAQLKALLVSEAEASAERLVSILHYDGLPIDCRCIVDAISARLERGIAA